VPSIPPLVDDVALALRLADAADAMSLPRFRALDLVVERKPDLTPVSDADRAVETTLREHLAYERPDDAVLGEEFGSEGTSSRRWVIDPIDGTKAFVRGVPVWATLMALMDGDEVILGVVSAPALGRRWWAATGLGAHTRDVNGSERSLQVSRVGEISDAWLSYSTGRSWGAHGLQQGFDALCDAVWHTRAYGDFWSHVMVAEGCIDLSCEPVVELYDIAALDVIVREAGGRLTATDGKPGPTHRSVLASNGLLHEAALGFLTSRS
jgi:histidinol-phosphatase